MIYNGSTIYNEGAGGGGGEGEVKVFTGTWNPDASPADYSGLPSSDEVITAIESGKDVVLQLDNGSGTITTYQLVSSEQYIKRFAGLDKNHSEEYIQGLLMNYAGPDNPWGWAYSRFMVKDIFIKNLSAVTGFSDFSNALSSGKACYIRLDTLTNATVISAPSNRFITISDGKALIPVCKYESTRAFFVGYIDDVFVAGQSLSDQTYCDYGTLKVMIVLEGSTVDVKIIEIMGGTSNIFMTMPTPTAYGMSYGRGNGVNTQSGGILNFKSLSNTTIAYYLFSSEVATRSLVSQAVTLDYPVWNTADNSRQGYFPAPAISNTYDGTTFPPQTPRQTMVLGKRGDPNSNDPTVRFTQVTFTMRNAAGTADDTTATGYLVEFPSNWPSSTNGEEQVYTAWQDSNGGHIGFKTSGLLVANPYSPSSTYKVGDLVQYYGRLYRCSTAIPVAESWDSTHWTQTNVVDQIGSVKNGGVLTDAASVNVPNNALSTLSTAQATLTLNVNVGSDEVPNFAVEVTPSVDCTLTITKTVGNTTTTLNPSVAGGTSLTTGKLYQVTCVGSCWTLAEFEAPVTP